MTTTQSKERIIEPTITPDKAPDPRGLGGLVALVEGVEQALPLQEVKVRTSIVGDCCRTVIDQRFANVHDSPLEATHIFPLPEDGAVIEMELRAGDKVIRAECRERKEAQRVFEEARKAGHRAGLLTQERADVHTLRVTNLPPKTDITVRIVVVERLENIDGLFRWRFPTVIAPRYLPGEPIGHDGMGTLPDTDHVPDASRLQPPLRLEGGTMLDLEVEIHGPVRSIESSLHAVTMDLPENGTEGVRIAPSGSATLNRDFILAFSTADDEQTGLRAWTDGAYTLVVVEPPSNAMPNAMPRDAVFVIDVSGSMAGTKIKAAQRALKSALHGLVEGDRFKLIAFNQSTDVFAKGFTTYDQDSLEDADRWIARLKASGGTEMLPAIKEALTEDTMDAHVQTVLFITDGQAWNEAELMAAVHYRREDVRFFTMGIDTAVNSTLLKSLARVGGGTCELLTPQDDIEQAVARLEARFGSPLVDNLEVDGGVPADDRPRTLFVGRPVSLLLKGAPDVVRVGGTGPEGEYALEASPRRLEFALGALWARERIASLEDRITLKPSEEEATRPEITRIALEHNIVSKYTAFVAVDTSISASGERIEIVQPVELPQDWDEAFVESQRSGPKVRMQYAKVTRRRSFDVRPSSRPEAVAASSLSEQPAYNHYEQLRGDGDRIPLKHKEIGIDGTIAGQQQANGSFGGDVDRTAAALLALVLLGSTRHKGLRKRIVIKAAVWLEKKKARPNAALALDVLARAEAGETLEEIKAAHLKRLTKLTSDGEEGKWLKIVLEAR